MVSATGAKMFGVLVGGIHGSGVRVTSLSLSLLQSVPVGSIHVYTSLLDCVYTLLEVSCIIRCTYVQLLRIIVKAV